MTARFVYWMNVSLDLLIEHTEGEQGAGDCCASTSSSTASSTSGVLEGMQQGNRPVDIRRLIGVARRCKMDRSHLFFCQRVVMVFLSRRQGTKSRSPASNAVMGRIEASRQPLIVTRGSRQWFLPSGPPITNLLRAGRVLPAQRQEVLRTLDRLSYFAQ